MPEGATAGLLNRTPPSGSVSQSWRPSSSPDKCLEVAFASSVLDSGMTGFRAATASQGLPTSLTGARGVVSAELTFVVLILQSLDFQFRSKFHLLALSTFLVAQLPEDRRSLRIRASTIRVVTPATAERDTPKQVAEGETGSWFAPTNHALAEASATFNVYLDHRRAMIASWN